MCKDINIYIYIYIYIYVHVDMYMHIFMYISWQARGGGAAVAPDAPRGGGGRTLNPEP